ncbi:MAG: class I SAM-dependent methyltransferase [Archangium sp.]|nr:class I SAM-dependent methyltransferase [Archangium sp.]
MRRSNQRCRVCDVRLPSDEPPERCDQCGFVYLGAGASRYDYDAEYDENSDYNALAPEQVLAHYAAAPNTGWALEQLRTLRATENASSMFEFGASQGAFLALAAKEGYRVHGVELASASIRYGHEKLGLVRELEQGVWRARRDDEAPVDAVCAFEVLEHSEDPIDFLRMMRTWAKPGGRLLISVPNGRRLSVRLGRREAQDFPPHHLMYWTARSLETAAVRVGLTPVEVKTSALTHSDLLHLGAPKLAARRAVDVGGFQPVGSVKSRRGLPSALKLVFPLLVGAGRLVATGVDRVPELGQRLMMMARA